MSTVRFNSLSIRKYNLCVVVAEALTATACLLLAYAYTYLNYDVDFVDAFLRVESLTFVTVLILAMGGMGLYHSRNRSDKSELFARIVLSFMLATVTLALIFYFIPYFDEVRPKPIAFALIFSFIAICLLRLAFNRLDRTGLLKKRILVLGAGERASIIHFKMRRDADRRGFRLMGYVDMRDNITTIPEDQILTVDLDKVDEYVERYQIDEIVIATDERRGKLPMDALYRCRIAGINILGVTSFVERELAKLPLHLMHQSWVILGDGYRKTGYTARAVKRIFDMVVSFAFLFITWPIMLITAMLIKIESGTKAPVFYTQVRVGRNSEPFKIYKFRSMREDAEKGGAVWAMENDNRITAVGAFIRKYRIDELPQLVNILKGDMSFIGPRPERPEFVAELSEKIPYYGDRHRVKPGLTGWAQICYPYGSSDQDAMEKLQYDLYYIKNYTLLLDTVILIQTCEVIFFGKGAR